MSWVVWDRAWGDATVAPAQPAQPAMAIARGCSGDPQKPRVFGLFLFYLADAKCKATGFQDFHVTIAYNCSAGMHLMRFDSNRKSDAGRPQSTKTCSKTSCQLSCHCRQMQLVPLGAEDPTHTCSAWHLKVGTVRHCETLWDRVSHKTPPQRGASPTVRPPAFLILPGISVASASTGACWQCIIKTIKKTCISRASNAISQLSHEAVLWPQN